MFGVLLLHAVYAVLMYAFSFRIMVVPHAIAVALMGIYMIFVWKRTYHCAYSIVCILVFCYPIGYF